MSLGVYTLLTEFKFDIGGALLGSQSLQDSLGKLTSAAEQAQSSMMQVGAGFLGTMGLGTTGILGSIWTMIQASEKYEQSKRKLAMIMLSNNMTSDLSDAMKSSADAMEAMARSAAHWSLPANVMLETTQGIAAALASAHIETKGLGTSIDIARNYLKAAPILGIDPGMQFQNLIDMVMGRAQMGDRFTQRLFADTAAFEPYRKSGGLQGFNALPAPERVKKLVEALGQFGNRLDVIELNAKSLSGQLQVLRDQLYGAFSILRNIGEWASSILANAILQINEVLSTNGRNITKQISDFAKSLAKSPEDLYVAFRQVSGLKADVKSAGRLMEVYAITMGIGGALKYFGVIAKGFSPWIGVITTGITLLIDLWVRMPATIFKILGSMVALYAVIVAVAYAPVIGTILAISSALTYFFSIFTRAAAIAKINDVKALPRQVEDLTRNMNALKITFGRLWEPFDRLRDYIAKHIAFLFEEGAWYDFVNNSIFKLVYGTTIVETFFAAVMKIPEAFESALKYFTSNQFLKDPLGIGSAFMKPIDDVVDKIFKENMAPYSDPSNNPIASQVVNINKVEINSHFKEQMEPDRIAFTLKEQLMKAAANKGQAAGRTMRLAEVNA